MKFLIFLSFMFVGTATYAQSVSSVEEYDSQLPLWGTTWTAGSKSVMGYYPSFYTGFAMRSASPERIHVRLSRGNQTRVSVILDEQTLKDYLFDLVARDEFYKGADTRGLISINPDRGSFLPQYEYFSQILNSSLYGIAAFVDQAKRGQYSDAEIYAKSLSVLKALNSQRVFNLKINLTKEFLKWQKGLPYTDAVMSLNSLVWGRVNLTQTPNSQLLAKLEEVKALAQSGNQDSFVTEAAQLFLMATNNKYRFKTLSNGRWSTPVQCVSASSCYLTYPEFTTIYPTGSVKGNISDRFGNSISNYATPGLWKFVERSTIDVDNIRHEQYYGWIPKMDYEAAGNGFHNPAVRFMGLSSSVKSAMGIRDDQNTFWSVKRGGVSHGCSRLAAGHAWELRHIFPVESQNMTDVYYFGNHPQDFDLFDIDGDGSLEVMGVEYLISYGMQGASGLASREGRDLDINEDKKLEFYQNLYGSNNVFEQTSNGSYEFINPQVSIHSPSDFKRHRPSYRIEMKGRYPLYEQKYEKDKIQFYAPYTTANMTSKGQSYISKRIVRLLGRVRGCAPTTNKSECGEQSFINEANQIFNEAGK